MEGKAKAKAKGVCRGRKPSIDGHHPLCESGMGTTAIAKNSELAELVSTVIGEFRLAFLDRSSAVGPEQSRRKSSRFDNEGRNALLPIR